MVALLALLVVPLSSALPASAQEKEQADKPVEQPSNCPMSFSDVRTSDYFYDGVLNLYCGGAITGYSDGSFRPYNSATRAQLSKIVVLAERFPLNTGGGPHFSDVPPSNPFYAFVETAVNRGMIAGYSDGTFRPNASITRSQLAKVVVVAKAWPLVNPPTARFRDVPAGSPFYTYVETAVARGAISGYSDGTFRPGSSSPRGQISKILCFSCSQFALTPQEQQTVDLINGRRVAMGLAPLRVNQQLTSAARRHSNDIGPAGICSHTGTDGSSPWDRIDQAGYAGFGMGEVVGCGYTTPQGVVDGWWASPGHYGILTDPGANDIGCGWYINPTNGAGTQTCDTGDSN
jgi:uncharacterized protein YkwD